jgi:hypothetical protein
MKHAPARMRGTAALMLLPSIAENAREFMVSAEVAVALMGSR